MLTQKKFKKLVEKKRVQKKRVQKKTEESSEEDSSDEGKKRYLRCFFSLFNFNWYLIHIF